MRFVELAKCSGRRLRFAQKSHTRPAQLNRRTTRDYSIWDGGGLVKREKSRSLHAVSANNNAYCRNNIRFGAGFTPTRAQIESLTTPKSELLTTHHQSTKRHYRYRHRSPIQMKKKITDQRNLSLCSLKAPINSNIFKSFLK
jgi:hypothetical protein